MDKWVKEKEKKKERKERKKRGIVLDGLTNYLWSVPARFRVLNTPKGENELLELEGADGGGGDGTGGEEELGGSTAAADRGDVGCDCD